MKSWWNLNVTNIYEDWINVSTRATPKDFRKKNNLMKYKSISLSNVTLSFKDEICEKYPISKRFVNVQMDWVILTMTLCKYMRMRWELCLNLLFISALFYIPSSYYLYYLKIYKYNSWSDLNKAWYKYHLYLAVYLWETHSSHKHWLRVEREKVPSQEGSDGHLCISGHSLKRCFHPAQRVLDPAAAPIAARLGKVDIVVRGEEGDVTFTESSDASTQVWLHLEVRRVRINILLERVDLTHHTCNVPEKTRRAASSQDVSYCKTVVLINLTNK